MFQNLITGRVQKFVPQRLPEVARGAPEALQMPGGRIEWRPRRQQRRGVHGKTRND